MAKRISESDIVSSGKRVLPAGHPDLIWYDPSKVIVVGEESEYRASGTGISLVSGSLGGSLTSGSESPEKGDQTEEESRSIEKPDVPDLSDIENVEYVKYFDPVSKIEKVKVIIKVRNSSKNKNNVAGVDARIYQPRGA